MHSANALPLDEYTRRLQARQSQRDLLAWRESWLGNGRLVVFLTGVAMGYLAFAQHWFSPWWLVAPAVLFSAMLVFHEKVTRAWLCSRRAVAFYERGLERLSHRWIGAGQQGQRFVDEDDTQQRHPNAADLNLFGKGSLFELLCTARTRTGEDTLAAWLRAPATPNVVRDRQAAVAELRPLLDLREDLALLGSDVPHGVDFDALMKWGEQPPLLVHRGWQLVALVLGAAGIVTLIGLLAWDWGISPLFGVLFMQMGVNLRVGERVKRVIGAVEKRARDLVLLAGVLDRLERETFQSHRLQQLRKVLDITGEPPSDRIAKLCNLIDLLNSRRNQLFMPFALLLMWSTHMAYAIDKWRRSSGSAFRGWLAAVGEFEALCSLATYSYENPADPFPEIVDAGPCVEGEELGHPLIPDDRCVRNSIRLNDSTRVLIVSGSNMSGKSTMLRTVGINTVLALAGGPVRAARLRVSPLVIGATLRIQDSLQAGQSRFFAELLRVRQIVDLSRGQPPLLFLLDEIFHGTNSHDRRIGAQTVIAGLVRAGAIGMVTTHDLTLTHIAETLAPRAVNVHFADHFEAGKMVFDYKMRDGIVQHSNALALMQSVGLDVDSTP